MTQTAPEGIVVYHTERLREWCEAMWSGDYHQGEGKLAVRRFDREGNDEMHYCCLGLGSHLAGLTPQFSDGEDRSTAYYGERGCYSLAPREFIDWLGIDRGMESADEFDLWLDLPWRLPVQGSSDDNTVAEDIRHDIDTWLNEEPGREVRDYPYFSMLSTTLAGLNDDHFTFAQIADLAWYFGVRIDDPAEAGELSTYWVQ